MSSWADDSDFLRRRNDAPGSRGETRSGFGTGINANLGDSEATLGDEWFDDIKRQVQRLVVVGSGAGSPIMSQPTNPISYAGLVTQPLSPYVKRRGQGDGGGGGAPLNAPSTWQPPVTLRDFNHSPRTLATPRKDSALASSHLLSPMDRVTRSGTNGGGAGPAWATPPVVPRGGGGGSALRGGAGDDAATPLGVSKRLGRIAMLSDLSRDLTPRFDRAGDAHAHLASDPRRAAADRGDVSSVAAYANYAVPATNGSAGGGGGVAMMARAHAAAQAEREARDNMTQLLAAKDALLADKDVRLTDMRRMVHTQGERVSELELQLNATREIEGEVTNLAARVRSLHAKLSAKEETIERLTATADEQAEALAAASAREAERETLLAERTEQLEALRSENEAALRDLAGRDDAAKRLEAENARSQKLLASQDSAISELRFRISQMRGDMESLSRDAVAARAAGEQRMRDDYQATQLELDSLRDEKELLTAIIAKQKKDVREVAAEREKLRNTVASLEARAKRNDQSQRVAELEAALARAEERADEAMRAAEATRREAATRAKRDADEIASLQALLDVHESIDLRGSQGSANGDGGGSGGGGSGGVGGSGGSSAQAGRLMVEIKTLKDRLRASQARVDELSAFQDRFADENARLRDEFATQLIAKEEQMLELVQGRNIEMRGGGGGESAVHGTAASDVRLTAELATELSSALIDVHALNQVMQARRDGGDPIALLLDAGASDLSARGGGGADLSAILADLGGETGGAASESLLAAIDGDAALDPGALNETVRVLRAQIEGLRSAFTDAMASEWVDGAGECSQQ